MVLQSKEKRPATAKRPDWLLAALRACKPPDTLTVTDFVQQHELRDRGRIYIHSMTPYLGGIMDAFTDPTVEQIWFCKPTQVGGTRVIFNLLAYIIAQDPDDTMIVYPTLELVLNVSKNRIQPMIEASPVLSALYLPQESTDLELHFSNGMILVLAGANSAASLASRPIRYLFFDEVDKFPASIGVEAGPIKLAIERTKTFPHNKKIVGCSTPTLKTGSIWQEIESCTQVLSFVVPCPHCGKEQTMRTRGAGGKKLLRWPEGASAEEAKQFAWYECEYCESRITDAQKRQIVQDGRWIVTDKRSSSRRKLGFRLNTFPSPWVSFGDIAHEFLISKDDPIDLQNFTNSWEGEVYEDSVRQTSVDLVKARQANYQEGEIPNEAQMLTGGVDYQPVYGLWYWTIRAWGAGVTSWNVTHGCALSWSDIETIFNRVYRKQNGEEMLVNLCAIDSGAEADEVYEFCARNSDWAMPIKGASRPLQTMYQLSKVEKADSAAFGMRLVIVDSGKYKSAIASRLNRPNGKGSWMVYSGIDEDYAAQVTSEHKVMERVGRATVEVWRPKISHAANHYLDAEVYAFCAADICLVRHLTDDPPAETTPLAPPPEGGFVPGSEWLPLKGSWL